MKNEKFDIILISHPWHNVYNLQKENDYIFFLGGGGGGGGGGRVSWG